ncbi:taxadiene 5-alpha hydroxylase [Pyrus ussuriensis x Pyrus communis]|uniref:Taxadiene 5-alpha hydroxylase n=1 Tax=Pyrus ussuriensis x Pyrus communis TaxID=2448454 RepID=A0A5N5G6T2_9ROSA|nr:taxadiene 5-alpha hydroxylase [Pyrus ussuriensis x Pyrus communis]
MANEISNHYSFCLFCFLAATVFFIVLLRHKKPRNTNKKRLPPDEMGLPWLGQTMEFYKSQRKNSLFDDFIQPRIAKYGKIFTTHLMGSPTVIVNGANANKFLLSNEFKLVVSSWPSASWKGQDEISLYRSTKILTFTIVFECFFGIIVEAEMLRTFERVLEGVFTVPVQIPGSRFWRAKKARVEIANMLIEVVREKRMQMEGKIEAEEEKGGTLLSQLVAGMIRGEINEEEVVDNVVLLVFAAHDTTSFAIAMTSKMLAQHPYCHSILLKEAKDQGENLTQDDTKKMKYTWQVARESMRLFPPIFGSFRKAIADIEYEGFTIPRGWKVLWTTYGTHYNSEYFQDPLSFNPSRFEESVPQNFPKRNPRILATQCINSQAGSQYPKI